MGVQGLRSGGIFERGWLGFRVVDVIADIASELKSWKSSASSLTL